MNKNGTSKLVRESSTTQQQERPPHNTIKEHPVLWINNNFYRAEQTCCMDRAGRLLAGAGGGGGDDSPVSVVQNFVHQQLSLPSSASTSMEHPISPLRHYCEQHKLQYDQEPTAQAHDKAAIINGVHVRRHISNINEKVRGLYSEQGQDGPFDVEYSGKWVVPTRRTIEWRKEENSQPAEGDHEQAVCRLSAKDLDDDEDEEESVIDFFPSTNRASSLMQARRRSCEKSVSDVENGKTVDSIYNTGENRRNLSTLISEGLRSYIDDEAGGGVDARQWPRSSSKWGDGAERWLNVSIKPPAKCTASCTSAQALNNDNVQQVLAHRRTAAAYTSTSELLQLVQAKLLLDTAQAATVQDKHVPNNQEARFNLDGISSWLDAAVAAPHTTREVGTEVAVPEGTKDMATQSTPMEWSRCDSPAVEEDVHYGTDAEKPPHVTTTVLASNSTTSLSPPRHNTPARRSTSCSKQPGRSGCLNLLELESCHLAKLKLARDLPLEASSTWQEEAGNGGSHHEPLERKSPAFGGKFDMLEARVSAWEDVERAKHHARFMREEAKIEAWESLQRAEVDAELRKLEVKLEKIRFEGREKIMARLEVAQKRARDMRAMAEAHKLEQLIRIGMRANHIRKTGNLPSSAFNIVCNLTTKMKPTSSLL